MFKPNSFVRRGHHVSPSLLPSLWVAMRHHRGAVRKLHPYRTTVYATQTLGSVCAWTVITRGFSQVCMLGTSRDRFKLPYEEEDDRRT
jgi:hypothetical protein